MKISSIKDGYFDLTPQLGLGPVRVGTTLRPTHITCDGRAKRSVVASSVLVLLLIF